MSDVAAKPSENAPERRLGGHFRRTGWIGFWLQIILCVVPLSIGALIYFASPNAGAPSANTALVSTLTMGVLLILVVTTALFFYYARIGKRLQTGTSRWTRGRLKGLVRFGLLASGISVFASALLMLWEATFMLRTFLEFPQGGVPVIQTTMQDSTWISALDVLSLLTLALSILTEILVLGLGLWLMYWLTHPAPATASDRSVPAGAVPEPAV